MGLVVMLVALGPAVFFLFYRRYRQAYAGRRAALELPTGRTGPDTRDHPQAE